MFNMYYARQFYNTKFWSINLISCLWYVSLAIIARGGFAVSIARSSMGVLATSLADMANNVFQEYIL